MTGILGSVSNLIGSILDVFASIFNALLSGVQSVFAVAGTLVSDVVGLAEGFVGFILGEFGFSFDYEVSWGVCLLVGWVVGRFWWNRGKGGLFDWLPDDGFGLIRTWGRERDV